jgi:hypothetical protein
VNSGGLPAVCEEGLSAVSFTRQLFGGVAGLTPITGVKKQILKDKQFRNKLAGIKKIISKS